MIRLVFAFLFLIAACGKISDGVKTDKIYMFYSDSCPHCHQAMEYMSQQHTDLEIIKVNIGSQEGRNLLAKVARHYKISGRFGVPLITFGENYLMGWGPGADKKFEEYLQKFGDQRK